jgi:excisionase family DNA binding protein
VTSHVLPAIDLGHRYTALPPLDVNQRYTVEESALYLRISRAHFYGKVKRGEIKLIKDGSRSYVSGRDLARHSYAAAG